MSWGEAFEAARRRIDARAGLIAPEPQPHGALTGYIDLCDGARVVGWAPDAGNPNLPVRLDIVVDGSIVARVLANKHRPDVEAAGHGTGRHGYEVVLPTPLDLGVPHTVAVRQSADGASAGLMRLKALRLPIAA